MITVTELLKKNIPPPVTFADGLITEGLILLAGRPKCGKSFMALNMGISIATGAPVLGNFSSTYSKTAALMLEDSEARIQQRFQRMQCSSLNGELDGMTIEYDLPKTFPERMEFLQNLITDGFKVIYLDTLFKFIGMRRSGNQYDIDYATGDKLHDMALKNHVALVALHHTRKDVEFGHFTELVSGTHGLTASCDTILVLYVREDRKTVLGVTGRDVPEAQHEVEFDDTIATWNVIGAAGDIALSGQRLEIIKALSSIKNERNKAMKVSEVATQVGREVNTVRRTLDRMVSEDNAPIERPVRGMYKLAEKLPEFN